ncbi:ABC transporter substrate-binding protein [Piscinibacter sp.]|uniref:ABC transporter substrate-binding protein n=1 Tax=Piscinibacter sp. TaxID=1903157 RepID=UPI002C1C1D88|nr:ABC transporter substrate-binding protein [Albitalea sp.]HUG21268.1 ABC transporter substrate-binding protein [Albitalea sp.]
MKRWLSAVCLAVAVTGVTHAKTFRWASAGDVQTMDPVSQNESFTNAMNSQIYEYLVARDKELDIVPSLATEWTQDGPLKWTFKLRRGVKFHDGRPFTADDVVFSVQRASEKTSQIANYATALGEPKKLDDHTVEFNLKQFNPVLLEHLNAVFIMSKSWCEEHKVTKPQDFTNKEETHAARHTNGTGPYMLVSRQPDVKTVLKRNPNYWGKIEGNLDEVVYLPIINPATRVAALISGEVDFILDPPTHDLERLRQVPNVKVIDGMENRIVFIGMDQGRDELLYSSVKGKNPFKDVRVRRALYQAVDIETIKNKLMNGKAVPTGAVVPSPLGSFNDPEIEKRVPYDLNAAKKLMAEAGYPDGFEITLDCPNNRYINDERICIALANMWAQLKVKVRVNAMPKTTYFPKLEKLDTSMYMLGWGGAVTDPETTFTPVYRNRGPQGQGFYNYGNYKDDELDALAAASTRESDPAKRKSLIKQVFLRHNAHVRHIPLHRQFIPWAARSNVSVVHRADNRLKLYWVTVK